MSQMCESRILEFKENITSSFLKTICAYSNYDGGRIIFGINDNGEIVGLSDNLDNICLDLENQINDSIKPNPNYEFIKDEKKNIITLLVYPGNNKPYYYKGKTYKRNDTSTIEVDLNELKRLILESENLNYEDIISKEKNLTFNVLESKLKEVLEIKNFDDDTLKTLKLMSVDNKYNMAAELLSDQNKHMGIDIVKFGENISIFKDRRTFNLCSILKMYDDALNMFKQYYTYEEVIGSKRIKKELVPEEAFRETIANALVHRTWDVEANIKVSMYDDYIEVTSIGGLPKGMTKEMYLGGNLSIVRNPIIANVFYRLNLIEQFGTGIKRIEFSYKESKNKPIFKIEDNFISVRLPVFKLELNLTEDEEQIYNLISSRRKSSSEIILNSNFGRTKTIAILNKLLSKGVICSEGTAKGKKYFK